MSRLFYLAKPYAKAIFRIAKQNNTYEKWTYALDFMNFILTDNNALKVIDNLTVSKERKANFIIDLMKENIDDKIKKFVFLLSSNKKLDVVPQIRILFNKLKYKELNIKIATIVSAVELSEQQKEKYINILEDKFSCKIKSSFKVDKSLIGGIKIFIENKVMDFSLYGKIHDLEISLLV